MKYIDAEKLKEFIEHKRDCVCDGLDWDDMDECQRYAAEYLDDILANIECFKQEQPGVWIKIDEDHPLPYGQEVIGYNKEWVNEDFNPSGTRIGFLSDIGFQSAKWNNDQDCYDTPCEEGDDYILSQIQHDGTKKTWCKYENGEAVEGYLPNMPTHYMLIPKTPDGFAWPYNARKEE